MTIFIVIFVNLKKGPSAVSAAKMDMSGLKCLGLEGGGLDGSASF